MNIFIFGNGNISFEDFLTYYKNPLKDYLGNKKIEFTATHVKLDNIDNQCIIFLLRGLGNSSIFLIIYSNKGSKVILLPNNR